MRRPVATLCAIALVAAPVPVAALSVSDVFATFGHLACVVREHIGFPCPAMLPGAPALSIEAPALAAAAASAGEASGTPGVSASATSSSAAASSTQVLSFYPEDFVSRDEFVVTTGRLEGEIASALAQARATSTTIYMYDQRPAPVAPSTFAVSAPSSARSYDADIANLWQALSLTNKIDTLKGVTITDSTFSGTFTGTFSGTIADNAISAASLALSGGFSGTSITGTTLTITGTSTAATTTSAILDTRGQVCNVQAYGAVGDNSTDNYAAITSAIQACPQGGVVFFPPGTYRISQTLVLDEPVTLQGTYAPRWTYSAAPRTSIKPTPTFSGSHIIHVRDKTISGKTDDNNGGRIMSITIDGNSYGSGVNGIYFEGLVRDWKLSNVDITQTSGDGFEAAQGTGSGNARGFTIEHLAIYSPASHGFRATALNDSYLEDVLVVGGAQRGFYITSMGETKISNSRAAFNALEGLYIDGSSTNGGLQITNFSTDRNDRHGVRISATGTTTIAFDNLLTRRDGPNDGGGGEAPYAGVAIIGTAGNLVAPVIIKNLTQIPGRNDAGAGTAAPATGVRAEYASFVSVDGVLWGVSSPYTDGGNNTYLFIGEESLLKTGFTAVSTTIYNKKWMIATSTTGLVYTAGSVGIGTTSPTAQFHTTGTVRFSNLGPGGLQTDANGNVTVSSDERLKDVLGAYDAGLEAILMIDPISYRWNSTSGFDTETTYAGFSAQDVREAIPAAVGEDPHGFLTLSDRPILAALVNALKTLWETVTGNAEKTAELEARIRVLEERAGIMPAHVPVPEPSGTPPLEVVESGTSTPEEVPAAPADAVLVPEISDAPAAD